MLAAVAAGFASCSIREMGAPEAPANRIAVTVNASFDGTKTVFGTPADGKIPVSWEATDSLFIYEYLNGTTGSQYQPAKVASLENDGANAKFTVSLVEAAATTYDYFALYPYSAYRKPNKAFNQVFDYAWPVDTQCPTSTGPDKEKGLMMAFAKGLSAQPTELTLQFKHISGYGKVSIKDVKLAASESIEFVELIFPGHETGGRYNYYAADTVTYQAGTASNILLSTEKIDTKSGSFDIWFATKPFTFKAGEKATVKVKTNKRNFTKEITAPSDLSFEAGVATAFAVDMSTAEAPAVYEADTELVFDFSACKTLLPTWPTSVGTEPYDAVYPINGTDYTFHNFKSYCTYDSKVSMDQLTLEKTGYVGLPVIEGARLLSVTVTLARASKSFIASLNSDVTAESVVVGGEQQLMSTPGDYVFNISYPELGKRYYIYGVGPLPINKITLYYDKDGEAEPEGPQPYDYPEVKGIEPITCLFWGETFGGANSKPLTGALNYKKLEDGSGIEFIAEEHNYAVPGATVSVPGCTFFEICSSAANKMFDTYALIKGNTADAPLPIFFSLPVKSALSGDLEFCCSINQGTSPTLLAKLTFAWSTDKTNWKNFDAVYSIQNNTPELAAGKTGFESTSNNSANNWAVCCFSIPEAEAIPVGGTFYVKAAPEFTSTMDATKTLRVNGGFMLVSKVQNTDFSASSNVIASRNFGDFWCGFQGMIGKPTRYFVSSYGNGANNKIEPDVADAYGWTPCGSFVPRRGYVWAQDNAEVAAYYQSPALAALTEPTDVMVTFKCCVFVDPLEVVHPDNFGVSVEGPGEVQELQKDSPAVPEGATHLSPEGYQWHKYYAVIKGATSETKVNVGKLTAITASRFYLDDIVITK